MNTARITFVRPDGTLHTVDALCGKSLMESARANAVSGILADCGGELSCSTCHCYVDASWIACLPKASDDETAMLGFVWEPKPNSRLTCQIRVTPDLDGLVLRVPERQI
jgi:ferredoxin, 2Fe-2S